jgi:hypothetical protein
MTSADKRADWNRGNPASAADDANTAIPLSYDWGAGLLDPQGAVNVLKAGRSPLGVDANRDGWNLDTISPADSDPLSHLSGDVYFLDELAGLGEFTATLNWYRHVDTASGGGGGLVERPLANLNMFLYSWDGSSATVIAESNSTVDSVEHLWLDIPFRGDYLLRVVGGSGFTGSETYAISWDGDFHERPVPEPSTWALAICGIVACGAVRRTSRRKLPSP